MVHIARDTQKLNDAKAREAVAGSSTPILTEEQVRQRQIEKDSQVQTATDHVLSAHPSTDAEAVNKPHGPSDQWAEQHRERVEADAASQVPKNSEVSEAEGGEPGGKDDDLHPVNLVPAAEGPADAAGEVVNEDRSSHIAPNGPETKIEDYDGTTVQDDPSGDTSQPTEPTKASDYDGGADADEKDDEPGL